MNRKQAYDFLTEVYQEILVAMRIEKIPYYFSKNYIQTTDGVSSNITEFTNHISALNEVVNSISISPFYDFLFDEKKQTVTLRYTVAVDKIDGNTGEIEVIAIFELSDNLILRCNEQSCPLNQDEELKQLAKINY
ncbi:hypothetical protein JOC34_001803 [Virgibacillus halotolerans]|uniref:nuclear transport factor 2 family protein n=1 Tax=Virgibacillus halotolerans TaxID=1071053 RepID=UPI0019617A94|nr:nuclear transport factor 2 family protein [Virgibacillus halotolerans]MBM7599435.1 hypothetical protein [Virgibacillus halotolerans]